MILLPDRLRVALCVNTDHRLAALRDGRPEPDPVPLLKLFNPVGAATWIATELGEDGDTLFGMADLGFGCPELGSFSLRDIAAVHLPFGMRIERDEHFSSPHPLSLWADLARSLGSIPQAERVLLRRGRSPLPRLH